MKGTFRAIVVALLTWEAKLVLRRHKPKVIAITGSAGKTSSKDAVYTVLSEAGFAVRRSEKSYNSEIGVPLAILGLESGWGSVWRWIQNIFLGAWVVLSPEKYPEWLVLEVGADRPGDIRNIARWIRPDIAIITGIPEVPVHVEFFNSPHALAEEKQRLAEFLKPQGILVINGDDSHTKNIADRYKDVAVRYGFQGENAFVAEDAGIQYEDKKPRGMHFYARHSGERVEVSIVGALGAPRVYAALSALAVGEVVGIGLEAAAESLSKWQPPPGRMRIIDGIRGSIIIDDTYNSSPVAALAALNTLSEIHGAKKRIAVLGDMLELGRYSKDAHKQIGEHAKKCADMIVTVGFRAKESGQAALDLGMHDSKIRAYEQNEAERAGKELESEMREGVVVLVKGSQSMRMEKTVLEIMADPMRAEELLVRQDADWNAR